MALGGLFEGHAGFDGELLARLRVALGHPRFEVEGRPGLFGAGRAVVKNRDRAVGMRRHIADHFQDRVFYGGLTYNSHPLACAAALATLDAYESVCQQTTPSVDA